MPKTFSRSDWGARPASGGPGPLFGSTVRSIVLHWPATTKPIRGVENVMAALRGWQNLHMDDKDWSDIAYQEAYDQDGNTYILRGLDTQPGANGDEATNKANGALLLILAPGEQPSPAMLDAVRAGIANHRLLFRLSTGVKGHSEVRPEPTSCPGPVVLGMIHRGVFEPVPVRPSTKPVRTAITAAMQLARKAGRTKAADGLRRIRDGLRP